MNHRHRKILHGIFAHPLNRNLDPQAVESLLGELGAELNHTGNGAVRVKLGATQDTVHMNDHSLAGEEVMRVRKLLQSADIDPERDYPL